MINQDFSQLGDTLLHKLQLLFSNDTITKIVFGCSIVLLITAIYSITTFALKFNSWQLPNIQDFADKLVLPEVNNVIKIENKHIFGKVTKPGATLANAVKTNLPLTLKGVMNESDPKLGAAIITGADGIDKNYHVGDKLPAEGNQVTLEYIFKDKVYIKNDDTIEYILYPKLEFKNQPRESGASGHQFLPNNQDSSNEPSIEAIDIQEKDQEPPHNQENIERMPLPEEAEKVSANTIKNFRFNKFNRSNKKNKRNYN